MPRFESWLYRITGALLGISLAGCASGDGKGTSIVTEYGVPSATYNLAGTIKDKATQHPIPGIAVNFGETKTFTDDQGHFALQRTGMPCAACALKVADVDGAQNGSYKDVDVPLTLKQTAPGDGRWFQGTFEQKDLVVPLEPK